MVDTDVMPGYVKDMPMVFKGWTVWYNGGEPLGPVRPPDEADAMVRKEAAVTGQKG